MSLIAKWTWGGAAENVELALAAAGVRPGQLLAVVSQPGIATLLGNRWPLVTVASRGSVRGSLRGSPSALPLADGTLAALVGAGAGETPDGARLLAEWTRAVRHGGAVVLVDRAPREVLTRRALCAGLREIEQRMAGRLVVTSGLVFRPV